MANREACELYIEQEIRAGLESGKKPYSIGKELATWLENKFEATISPQTLTKRAQRIEREEFGTNVPKHSNHRITLATYDQQNQPQIHSSHPENTRHGGARPGSGPAPDPYVETDPELAASATALPPQAKSHARPLKRLPEHLRAEAWRRAVESAPGGRVTARHVDLIVRQMMPAKRRPALRGYGTPEKIVMSPEFKKAYDDFYSALISAKSTGWRTTSKDTAIGRLNNLMAFIDA